MINLILAFVSTLVLSSYDHHQAGRVLTMELEKPLVAKTHMIQIIETAEKKVVDTYLYVYDRTTMIQNIPYVLPVELKEGGRYTIDLYVSGTLFTNTLTIQPFKEVYR